MNTTVTAYTYMSNESLIDLMLAAEKAMHQIAGEGESLRSLRLQRDEVRNVLLWERGLWESDIRKNEAA